MSNKPNEKSKAVEKHIEFSKLIVKRGTWMFIIHTLLTLAVIFWKVEAAHHAVSLMSATVPLYIVIFGGYFGKAGLENFQKIRFWEQSEQCETQEQNG